MKKKKDKAEGHKPSETQKTEESEKSEKEKTDMKVPDENATECLTVNDQLDFTAILSGKKDPVKTFQELCKAIFSVDELILCSPTGKRTVKCADSGA